MGNFQGIVYVTFISLIRAVPVPAAFMYVLVPMPALFFGGSPGSNLASSWVDAGKFLTGFSAVGSVAIPAILYHSGVSMMLRGDEKMIPFQMNISVIRLIMALCTENCCWRACDAIDGSGCAGCNALRMGLSLRGVEWRLLCVLGSDELSLLQHFIFPCLTVSML